MIGCFQLHVCFQDIALFCHMIYMICVSICEVFVCVYLVCANVWNVKF